MHSVDQKSAASATRKHINQVLKASGATCSKYSVLQALCRMADFHKPEVTATKAQLSADTRYTDKTIRKALRFLKSEGSILPIQDIGGGRGKAVTYRLSIAGQGAHMAAPTEPKAGDTSDIFPSWFQLVGAMDLDKNARSTWIEKLRPRSLAGGALILGAPSGFHARYVRENYTGRMMQAAQSLGLSIHRIDIDA